MGSIPLRCYIGIFLKNLFSNFGLHIKDSKQGRKCIFINCTSYNGSPQQIPFQFANGKLPHSCCRAFWVMNLFSSDFECGYEISDDCLSEYNNAVDDDNLDQFYHRCDTEGGSQPLRTRCSLCCNKGHFFDSFLQENLANGRFWYVQNIPNCQSIIFETQYVSTAIQGEYSLFCFVSNSFKGK